jgi:hypothetical protein
MNEELGMKFLGMVKDLNAGMEVRQDQDLLRCLKWEIKPALDRLWENK